MADSAPSEVVDFIRLVSEAESHNRQEAIEDMKFRFGDQWPVEIQNSRLLEARPCLTINETDAYLRQVANSIRMRRSAIDPHPTGGQATIDVAKVLKGIIRHIEVHSDADNAYDLASDFALTCGIGYWRVLTDYVRENSFDQDIFIAQIDNPFAVYFDPNSQLPDGSDSERAAITDVITKKAFRQLYPGAALDGFTEHTSGDQINIEWITKEDIRVAEYFNIERIKSRLVSVANPSQPRQPPEAMWEDELPDPQLIELMGLRIVGDRTSYKRQVNWCKVSAVETLDSAIWPGRWVPIVPVYGHRMVIDGKRKCFGMVRFAKDPQRMVNFWQTALTESIALAPKAKWLIAEGQIDGHENEWSLANIKAAPVLTYRTTDVTGQPAPPPQRLQPEPPPAGVIEAAMAASSNLQQVLGIFDPSTGKPSGPKSGKAIVAEQQQSDQSNFNYLDNMTRSQRHTGRIILDLVPRIYDSPQRIMRVIGDDGKPDLVTINERKDEAGAVKIKNDLTVGLYDIAMDTGPAFNTKRIEFSQMLAQILQGNQDLWKVAGDLFFRAMDFPGADTLADRLAAANPLAQIDEQSDIPPAVQMQLKQKDQQIQQLQQQMAQLAQEYKMKVGIEQGWQQTELVKAHLQADTKRADVRAVERAKIHDTETFAMTSQHVAEINAMAKILAAHLDRHLAERQMGHQARMQDKALAAEATQGEPAGAP
jgi:Phage P22-like portal protein